MIKMGDSMSKYKRIAIYLIMLGLVSILFGTTYSFFNYTRTGANNTLIVGNIYMNHTQGTEISLSDEFPQKKEDARARNDNTVTITITGYNESEKDIYYKLLLNHGDVVGERNRIDDKFLRFDLVELLANNEEKYIIYNESFDTINNSVLLKDRIDAGTSSSNSVNRTFQLRMWISDDILISDTNEEADYTTSEYMNLFGSVKITAKGDMQNVYYYDSLDDAITGVNAGSYSSTTTRSLAKVGIYTDSDDNTTNLVLYDDVELNDVYQISNPVDFNLYGYTIEDSGQANSGGGFGAVGNMSIRNGTIIASNVEANHGFAVAAMNSELVFDNIDFVFPKYDEEVGSEALFVAYTSSNIKIINSNIEWGFLATYPTGSFEITNSNISGAMDTYSNSNTVINDSEFYSQSHVLLSNGGTLIINNSTLFADSLGDYVYNGGPYFYSQGINNDGTLIFNSGYVFGTHAAIETDNGSKTYVYGGTFESTDTGGFYFEHGPSGVAYIENANIRGVSYPAAGRLRPNGTAPSSLTVGDVTATLEEQKTAFYSGGTSNANGQIVYIVNSNISSLGTQMFTIRYAAPQQSIYMSGCNFLNVGNNHFIRIDRQQSILYLGVNNNLGILNRVSHNSSQYTLDEARGLGIVVDQNANYKGIVSPE